MEEGLRFWNFQSRNQKKNTRRHKHKHWGRRYFRHTFEKRVLLMCAYKAAVNWNKRLPLKSEYDVAGSKAGELCWLHGSIFYCPSIVRRSCIDVERHNWSIMTSNANRRLCRGRSIAGFRSRATCHRIRFCVSYCRPKFRHLFLGGFDFCHKS